MSNKNQLDIFYSEKWKEQSIKFEFAVDRTTASGNYFGEYLRIFDNDIPIARLNVPGFKTSSIIGQAEWKMLFESLEFNLDLPRKQIIDMVKEVVPDRIFNSPADLFY
jgi:hypothetical protein